LAWFKLYHPAGGVGVREFEPYPGDVSPSLTNRKPFDLPVEGLLFGKTRGERI
jgi:hypothetical protein